MDTAAYQGKLGRALRTVGLSGDAFMVSGDAAGNADADDFALDETFELPLPGTPARAETDATTGGAKKDPFDAAAKAMSAAAAQAQAVTDAETAARNAKKKKRDDREEKKRNKKSNKDDDDDDDEKDAMRT